MYEVGFKDVYPWVWSVMLGVALTLAERRGAFGPAGTNTRQAFWAKNLTAVALNVGFPAIFFGLTMVRLGPKYSSNMGLWQILGVRYLAGLPLGAHHVWLVSATYKGWIPDTALQPYEREAQKKLPLANLVWAIVAFLIPALATVLGWRLPF